MTNKETHISRTLDIDEQPKSHHLATTKEKQKALKFSNLCLHDLLRYHRLDRGRGLDQVLHDLVALRLASGLDLLQLLLGLLAGIFFGLLESTGVLRSARECQQEPLIVKRCSVQGFLSPQPRTSCIPPPSGCGTPRSPSEPRPWRLLSAWYGLSRIKLGDQRMPIGVIGSRTFSG